MKLLSRLYVSIFITAGFGLCLLAGAAQADTRRTDGPEGSEWSDFSRLKGELSFGAQFGALIPSSGEGTSSLLGVDVDYRPYDLFGAKLTYQQALQTPRNSLFLIQPLMHWEFQNMRPFICFGPGLAITQFGETQGKFAVGFQAGADVMLTNNLSVGMAYAYTNVIASPDLNSLYARVAFIFN